MAARPSRLTGQRGQTSQQKRRGQVEHGRKQAGILQGQKISAAAESQKRSIAADTARDTAAGNVARDVALTNRGIVPPTRGPAKTKRQQFEASRKSRREQLEKLRKRQAFDEGKRSHDLERGIAAGTAKPDPKKFRGGAPIVVGDQEFRITDDPQKATERLRRTSATARGDFDIATGRSSLERLTGQEGRLGAAREGVGEGTPEKKRRSSLLNIGGMPQLQDAFRDVQRANQVQDARGPQPITPQPAAAPAAAAPATSAPTPVQTATNQPVPLSGAVGERGPIQPAGAPPQGSVNPNLVGTPPFRAQTDQPAVLFGNDVLLPDITVEFYAKDPNLGQYFHTLPIQQQRQIAAKNGSPIERNPIPIGIPDPMFGNNNPAAPSIAPGPPLNLGGSIAPTGPVNVLPQVPPSRPAPPDGGLGAAPQAPTQPIATPPAIGQPTPPPRQATPFDQGTILQMLNDPNLPNYFHTLHPDNQRQLLSVGQQQLPQQPQSFARQLDFSPRESSFFTPGQTPPERPDMAIRGPETGQGGFQLLPSDPIKIAESKAKIAAAEQSGRIADVTVRGAERQGDIERGEAPTEQDITALKSDASSLPTFRIMNIPGFGAGGAAADLAGGTPLDQAKTALDDINRVLSRTDINETVKVDLKQRIRSSPMYLDVQKALDLMERSPNIARGRFLTFTSGDFDKMKAALQNIVSAAQ